MTPIQLTDEQKKKLIAAVPVVLGLPYKYGVEITDKEIPYAFDCSELVEWLFRLIRWAVPDGSIYQFEASIPIKDFAGTVETGDLLFTQKNGVINHVAVALDANTLIEASGWRGRVVKTPVTDFYRTYRIPNPGEIVNHSTVHPDGFRRFATEKVKAINEA